MGLSYIFISELDLLLSGSIYTCQESIRGCLEILLSTPARLLFFITFAALTLSVSDLIQFPKQDTEIPFVHEAHLITCVQDQFFRVEVDAADGECGHVPNFRLIFILNLAQKVAFPRRWRYTPEIKQPFDVCADEAVKFVQEFANFYFRNMWLGVLPFLTIRAIVVNNHRTVV